ncbi:MAG: alpha-hydroxy-acid oxidizing protein [Cyclobacteriaceae bacterium]|nr:alpha-hydroxy-acid oxidizing protein [Cyclobacteriaceae bacterium HetDA_MAG_MS6]
MSGKKDELLINSRYPSVQDLRKKASQRIPKFAFEYLIGGANEEYNLAKNKSDIQEVQLMPEYLKQYESASLQTEIFGQQYDAPFGIAPVGLQGLMWPRSPEILAKAARQHNIPFTLSTVTTSSIEKIGEITEGKFWFQLYHPAENKLRDDMLARANSSGCNVLVALADTPSFGIRYKDIKNGLAMPPKMSVKNILQIMSKPKWALQTLYYGQPDFATLKPYMPKNLNLSQLGKFMNDTFDGRLNEEKLKALRDLWKGKLVVKGVVNEKDAEKAVELGIDGIIVSNHGGRQLDAGESTIKPLTRLAKKFGKKMTIMMDGGMRSGPDIGRGLACGAQMVLMGRPFMYGVGALGSKGGDHTIAILKMQLKQVMEQLGCEQIPDLPKHLIS